MHPFEKAELGKAPFRVIGCFQDIGPHRSVCPTTGVTIEVGSPGQPMGVCKYCWQGIAICYMIESSDGKRFTVGSSCVAKTGDKTITSEVKRLELKAKNEKADERIRLAYEAFDTDPKVQEYLKAAPLPSSMGNAKGDRKWYGYIEYCRLGAGRSGKTKCARMIEKAQKEVE